MRNSFDLSKEELDATVNALFERLKGFDSQALAMGLANVVVGVGFTDVIIEKVFEEVKANSSIARKNRQIKTRNNKLARLKVLHAKKKLTAVERAEANKLIKDLGLF